jgi:hypothetical protein
MPKEVDESMKPLQADAFYFVIVFVAGFVLGTIRTLWVVPQIGTRLAELIETPIMLVVVIVSARWLVFRFAVPPSIHSRFVMGCTALILLLLAEFGLVLRLRGLSIREYFETMDPISGPVFFLMQGILAIMPLVVARR